MTDKSDSEVWADVPGYWGVYEVSSKGRVRSLSRVTCRGPAHPTVTRILKPLKNARGYLRVGLCRKGVYSFKFVHVLVLEAFVGVRPAGLYCRHINGNASDNRVENLRWGTAKENHQDKVLHGRSTEGEKHHSAKLTEEIVRAMRAGSIRPADAARITGVAYQNAWNAARGYTWRHIK